MPRAANLRDVTNGVLYDTQTVATSGTLKLTFFQQGRGNGIYLTNLRTPGQMPHPEAFIVRSIRIGVLFSGTYLTGAVAATHTLVSEWIEIIHLASVYFEVGSKPYLDYWPMHMFNLGQSHAATNFGPNTATAAALYMGSGTPGAVINLAHPIRLNPNEPFRGEIQWQLNPTPANAQSIQWILGGTWIRAVQ